jgi:hypothetical protein
MQHTGLAAAPTLAAIVDRLEVVDARYRFGAGQDLRDRPLFESAFTADAVLDIIEPARRFVPRRHAWCRCGPVRECSFH